MTLNLGFYQLLLMALVLICLMVHVWWPNHQTPTPRKSLKPSTLRRKRSTEPKPFTGHIHKPLCEACKQGADSRPKAPGPPPPLITFTRGRQRTGDTHTHFSPPSIVPTGAGPAVATSAPMAILALRPGVSFSAWLATGISLSYAVLSAVRDGDFTEAEAIDRLSRAPHWVWTAIDPETKVLLSVQVGERTLAMAQAMLHRIAQLLAPGWVPLFLSDGYAHDLSAIVTHFGHWVQPSGRQGRGPAPRPRWMPLPGLLYAHAIKTSADAPGAGEPSRGLRHT